jgi:hypothetical protein
MAMGAVSTPSAVVPALGANSSDPTRNDSELGRASHLVKVLQGGRRRVTLKFK